MDNVLVLGGTGAMGVALVKILSEKYTVYVTSRSRRVSSSNIRYIEGNAQNVDFLGSILKEQRWVAVVDFMVRNVDNLRDVLPLLLDSTEQYVFLSSARVYAESNTPITERTPRLLDISTDKEYLSTNEYALAKAREENLLLDSDKNNFTIIRPSITYNDYRLQLGAFEKEEWLYRALKGRTLVFSRDLADKITTMSHGKDVAAGIASIVGNHKAFGQVYHITSPVALTWEEVLKIYVNAIERKTGKKVHVAFTDKSSMFYFKSQKWRLIYCRLFNRSFCNSKISEFIDVGKFTDPADGLTACIEKFIDSPKFQEINVDLEAIHDRITGEYTPLSEIKGIKQKIKYILFRYNLTKIAQLGTYILKIFRTR